MTRSLRWTRRALARLDHIGTYISKHNPLAANTVVARIAAAASSLSEHPAQGRLGRVTGTRELVLADMPYIIVYRQSDDAVEILTVMHTSQRWPEKF